MVVLSPRPLHTLIVELLEKGGGSSKDSKLYSSLRELRKDLSFGVFNKTLMRLEVCGVVRVRNLSKGERIVELV